MNDKEMTAMASPKFTELARQMKEFNEQQLITNTLLSRLCDLKEGQAEYEEALSEREEIRDNRWLEHKKKSSRITHVLLIVAISAFSLDLIRADDGFEIITRVTDLCVNKNAVSEALCPFIPF